jgi:homoserine dehydrogenase
LTCLALVAIDMRPVNSVSLARAQRELRSGQVLRVVSQAFQYNGHLLGEVCLRALDSDHPLATVVGDWNRVSTSASTCWVLAA